MAAIWTSAVGPFGRWVLFALLLPCTLAQLAAADTLRLPFYGDTLDLAFDPASLPEGEPECSTAALRAWYERLNGGPWQPLYRSLSRHRETLGFNDWLTYRLLADALDRLLPRRPRAQTFFTWFYLGQAGFDARLTHRPGELYLYVHTRDTVYGQSFLRFGGDREYINMERPKGVGRQREALQLFQLQPWSDTRPFSFALSSRPRLPVQAREQELTFPFRGDTLRLAARFDANSLRIMNDYPLIAERHYLHVPLSNLARNSLVDALRRQVEGKPPAEALRLLVAFTRHAFAYEEDEEQFGWSKPMTAEETLAYPGSDCEDRCALLYQLVDELLELPMIIIAYPEHLTLGIALDEPVGLPVRHQGRDYYLCDPTGPRGSSEIGRLPERFAHQAFTIIGQ